MGAVNRRPRKTHLQNPNPHTVDSKPPSTVGNQAGGKGVEAREFIAGENELRGVKIQLMEEKSAKQVRSQEQESKGNWAKERKY